MNSDLAPGVVDWGVYFREGCDLYEAQAREQIVGG